MKLERSFTWNIYIDYYTQKLKSKTTWKFHRIGQQLPCMPYLSSGQTTDWTRHKEIFHQEQSFIFSYFIFVWWWTNWTPHKWFHHCVLIITNRSWSLKQSVSFATLMFAILLINQTDSIQLRRAAIPHIFFAPK